MFPLLFFESIHKEFLLSSSLNVGCSEVIQSWVFIVDYLLQICRYSIYSWSQFWQFVSLQDISSSSEFPNLLAYKWSQYSFIILVISAEVNINVFSFIPNFSNVTFSFFLVSLAKSLSILLMFFKEPTFSFVGFSIFF